MEVIFANYYNTYFHLRLNYAPLQTLQLWLIIQYKSHEHADKNKASGSDLKAET